MNAATIAAREEIMAGADPALLMIGRIGRFIRQVSPSLLAPADVASRMGSEGPEHRWLRVLLHGVAEDLGFSTPTCLGRGVVPDVVRMDSSTGWLFVGDAKDARNQGLRDSYGQMRDYVRVVRGELRKGHVGRAVFAVATNELKSATEWLALSTIASEQGLAVVPATSTMLVGAWGTFVTTSVVRLP